MIHAGSPPTTSSANCWLLGTTITIMLVPFVALALALAPSSSLAHARLGVVPRKSLSFGPVHPHAKFTVEPAGLPPSFRATAQDPIELARQFANEFILPKEDTRRHSYIVREDSYTDEARDEVSVAQAALSSYKRAMCDGGRVTPWNIWSPQIEQSQTFTVLCFAFPMPALDLDEPWFALYLDTRTSHDSFQYLPKALPKLRAQLVQVVRMNVTNALHKSLRLADGDGVRWIEALPSKRCWII